MDTLGFFPQSWTANMLLQAGCGMAALLIYLSARAWGKLTCLHSAGGGSRVRRWEAPTVAILLIALKCLLASFMFGPWYWSEEVLDACIQSYQSMLGERIHDGGTNFVMYRLFGLAYAVFGSTSPYIARFTCATVSAVGMALYYGAGVRIMGRPTAMLVVALYLVSYPQISYSGYATAIAFGLLSPGGVLLLLTRRLTARRIVTMWTAIAFGMFAYPGGALVAAGLLLAHTLIFFRLWKPEHLAASAASAAACAGSVLLVKRALAPHSAAGKWAGGSFDPYSFPSSIRVILEDIFWRSTTWNSNNFGFPHFEPAFLGFALLCGGMLLVRTIRGELHARWRWSLTLATGAAIAIGLAGCAGPFPGVRRVSPALPLLYLALGPLLPARFSGAGVKVSALCIFLPLVFVALRTSRLAIAAWPLEDRNAMFDSVAPALRSLDGTYDALIVERSRADTYHTEEHRCAFGLDPEISSRFDRILIAERPTPELLLAKGQSRAIFLARGDEMEAALVNDGLIAEGPLEIEGSGPSEPRYFLYPVEPRSRAISRSGGSDRLSD